MIEKFGIDTIIIILTIKITTIIIIILRIFYNDQIHITNISINTKIKKTIYNYYGIKRQKLHYLQLPILKTRSFNVKVSAGIRA